MSMIHILIGIVILAFAAAFYFGKIHIHAGSWKGMTEEEKASIDIKALCHNIGLMIAVCGLLFCIGGLSLGFRERGFVLGFVLWMIVSGFDVYYIDKSRKYGGQ